MKELFSTHDDEDKEEESVDPIVQTPSHDEKTDDEDSHGMNVEGDEMDDEGANEEDDANELYRDVNINLKGQQQSSSVSSRFVSNMLNQSSDTCIDSIFNLNTKSTPRVDVPVTTTAELPLLSATTLPPPPTPIIPTLQQTPVPSPANVPSSTLQDLPNFRSLFGFDHRLKALEINFSEFMQINQFAKAISSIPDIVDKYLDHRMNEAIIKEQVKEQVKAQVSKILPKIKKTVNEQLEAEVLTRLSNSSKTSHVVATNLSELELKKILIEKMESNKSIHRSDEKNNLYKALVDTYEWSKRRRARKEPESTSAPKEKTSKTTGKSTEGFKSHHKSARESTPAEEPIHTTKDLEEPAHLEFDTGATDNQPVEEASQHPDWFQKQAKPPTLDRAWNKSLPATHGPIQPWISNLARKDDSCTSFNELMDTSFDFSAFVMNRLKVDTLTPELLAGLTYELMKGLCKSLVKLEFFLKKVYKATTNQLDWNNPEGQQYPHDLRKPLPLIPTSRGRRVIPFDHFINNDLEYLRGGVSIRMYTTSVTKTKAADYGHIKWIEDLEPRIIDDDKLYKFKEGDFKRFRIQDIEDMLLLLNHRHPTACGRSIIRFQKLPKKINLTKPDMYRSDLKRKEASTTYSNPRGFIYQNKDKQNRLMRIDELHKFSDGTLNDVWTALDDRLKGIRMRYLPQTIWRRSDEDRAATMIQAFDKQLKTRRIMRSLEKFVGGRLYEGYFWLLQRTI
nr:hypothetical protein [Tanacetum cinerariifolium]